MAASVPRGSTGSRSLALRLAGLSEGYRLKFGCECLDEAVLFSVVLLLAADSPDSTVTFCKLCSGVSGSSLSYDCNSTLEGAGLIFFW